MIQLLFGAVQMVGRSSTPVLVLQEQDGSRSLAVWISAGLKPAWSRLPCSESRSCSGSVSSLK